MICPRSLARCYEFQIRCCLDLGIEISYKRWLKRSLAAFTAGRFEDRSLLSQTKITAAFRIAATSVLFLAACQSARPAATGQSQGPNTLTHGAVQLKLQKGVTTQNDVIEAFGAPNITTIDGDGREVWTYRRHATVTTVSDNSSYFNILVFGAQSGAATGSQSSQSMTLVIKFDADKKVSDFRSMASSF